LDCQAEGCGGPNQDDHGDDAAGAARGFAADRAIEAAIEECDRSAGEDDRVWHMAENRRHIAKQPIDRETEEQQQGRVGKSARHHSAAARPRGAGRDDG
jgi:hypothetical protein